MLTETSWKISWLGLAIYPAKNLQGFTLLQLHLLNDVTILIVRYCKDMRSRTKIQACLKNVWRMNSKRMQSSRIGNDLSLQFVSDLPAAGGSDLWADRANARTSGLKLFQAVVYPRKPKEWGVRPQGSTASIWVEGQESISTCQPMSCCSRNTMPHRETWEPQAIPENFI